MAFEFCLLHIILQDKKYRFVYRLLSTIGFLIGLSVHKKGMAQGRFRFITRLCLFPNDTSLSTVLENYNRQFDDA